MSKEKQLKKETQNLMDEAVLHVEHQPLNRNAFGGPTPAPNAAEAPEVYELDENINAVQELAEQQNVGAQMVFPDMEELLEADRQQRIAQQEYEERLRAEGHLLGAGEAQMVLPEMDELLEADRQREAEARRQQEIKESGKKSNRKRAASKKKQADKERSDALKTRLRKMTGKRLEGEEQVASTILKGEALRCEKAPPREDLTGHQRFKNEKKFKNTVQDDPKAQQAAEKDVRNLVNNLRLDMSLEADTTIPQELKIYTDSFCFTERYGERVVDTMTRIYNRSKNAPGADPEQIKEEEVIIKKLQQFTTLQRSYASDFVPDMCLRQRDIRARQLARQQIQEGPRNAYQQRMLAILDRELETMQAEYNAKLEHMRTFNGALGTPRGAAQLAMRSNLAALWQAMQAPGVTEEEKKSLENQGRSLFFRYTYEGPMDENE